MKAKELEKKFDNNEDITKYLDVSKARRPVQEIKRVNVDFPVWMIHSLDKEAKRLGVPRQSIIKVWIAERLEKLHI
jgi:macrodomain Ter protein organizer (MatP/YcbG family)